MVRNGHARFQGIFLCLHGSRCVGRKRVGRLSGEEGPRI